MEDRLEGTRKSLSKTSVIDFDEFDRLRDRVTAVALLVESTQSMVAGYALADRVAGRADIWNTHYDRLDNLLKKSKAIKKEINKKDWVSGLVEPGKKFNSGVGFIDKLVNNTKKFIDFFRRGAQKLLSGSQAKDDSDDSEN